MYAGITVDNQKEKIVNIPCKFSDIIYSEFDTEADARKFLLNIFNTYNPYYNIFNIPTGLCSALDMIDKIISQTGVNQLNVPDNKFIDIMHNEESNHIETCFRIRFDNENDFICGCNAIKFLEHNSFISIESLGMRMSYQVLEYTEINATSYEIFIFIKNIMLSFLKRWKKFIIKECY